MKPILFRHSEKLRNSFFVLHEKCNHFYDTLHYHPEYQITFIIKGSGTFFIADRFERFSDGDIFILGPNIAHVFKSDDEYYASQDLEQCEYLSIYFEENSFGDGFFNIPENAELLQLLNQAQRGLKIIPSECELVLPDLAQFNSTKGAKSLSQFLLLLDSIAQLKEEHKHLLVSLGYLNQSVEQSDQKMNMVFNYVLQNFTKDIKLEEIAGVACMSSNAFCRFFKQRTRKSLFEFITELRIGYACKLILQKEFFINEVAYKSGFKNISNFNRQFKKITGKSPSEYHSHFKKIPG